MSFGYQASVFAIVTVLALASDATASASSARTAHPHYKAARGRLSHTYIRGLGHGGVAHARRTHGLARQGGTGYVSLVGDPDSGLGFYALPQKYRIGAQRYRLTHRRPWWDNPVLFAIAADSARYNYWIPANRDYAYGVFNPYEGVGTPFFGGYYGGGSGD